MTTVKSAALFIGTLIGVWCLFPQPGAAQSEQPLRKAVTCSPAPCVLPPKQASEGGALVTNPATAADPIDPQNLLVGSVDWNCLSMGFHISLDGGSNWTSSCLKSVNGKKYFYVPGSDPMVGFDRNGNAYAGGDYIDREGFGYGFAGIEHSSDGVNWSEPVVALGTPLSFPAWGWLTVDTNIASPFANAVYVSAVLIGPPTYNLWDQLAVSHSNDGGSTWTMVNVLPRQYPPAYDRLTTMAVGKDGAVYLTWMYCDSGPYVCTNEKGHMLLAKSTDGGDTWSQPVEIATVTMAGLPNSGEYGHEVSVYFYAPLGVDNSNGPHAGWLYVALNSWTGSQLRVYVAHSSDGGSTWSKPVPVAPASETHDQFYPWISASPTGIVGVSWLDRRNDPANTDYQAFAAFSSDGGENFGENVQLTTAFSNPSNNGYPDDLWMGDYTGNAWDGPDYFVASWMDSSNGVDMQEVVGGIRLK